MIRLTILIRRKRPNKLTDTHHNKSQSYFFGLLVITGATIYVLLILVYILLIKDEFRPQ